VFVRFRPFVALLLLALWLPATQHCGLEAAELWDAPRDCHAVPCEAGHDQSTCEMDSCQFVEDSAYRSTFDGLKLSAPILNQLTCWCCLHEITPTTIVVPLISPAQTNAPPELAPTWQFIARATGSPRAPTARV